MTRPDEVERERMPSPTKLLNKAQRLSTKGRYEEAIDASTSCLDLLRTNEAAVLLQMGKDLRMAKRQRLAIPVFEEAEKLATRIGDNKLVLKSIVDKVDALRTGDRDKEFPYPDNVQTNEEKMHYRFQEIPELLNRAQFLMSQVPESEATIDAFSQFGLVFDTAQDYKKSLEVYSESEAVSRRLLDKKPQSASLREKLARATHLRGRALIFLGRYTEAKPLEEESLQISEEQGNLRNKGNARLSLGDAELGLGNVERAKPIWEITREEAEKGNDKEIFDLANERLAKLQNSSN